MDISTWRAGAEAAGWTMYRVSTVEALVFAARHGKSWIDIVPGHYVLPHDLWLESGTTLCATAPGVFLMGHGLRIRKREGVLVHGINIFGAYEDGIEISESRDVLIEGCTVALWGDGAIDIKRESQKITVRGCHFHSGTKAMLIGHADDRPQDKVMTVTISNTVFGPRIGMRCPRVRYATVGLDGNTVMDWQGTALDLSEGARVFHRNMRFIPGQSSGPSVQTNSGAIYEPAG